MWPNVSERNETSHLKHLPLSREILPCHQHPGHRTRRPYGLSNSILLGWTLQDQAFLKINRRGNVTGKDFIFNVVR